MQRGKSKEIPNKKPFFRKAFYLISNTLLHISAVLAAHFKQCSCDLPQ